MGAAWDLGSQPENYRRSYGVELNFDTVLFYALDLQLNFGYAEGIDEGGEVSYYLRLDAPM